jgi:hypothetical protein
VFVLTGSAICQKTNDSAVGQPASPQWTRCRRGPTAFPSPIARWQNLNCEEPCAERVFVVELVPAFEHADPRFLEQVFRQFAAAGQVNQVAEKAMLVLLDEAVEQVGISTSKSTSNLGALLRHQALEIEGSRVHTTDTYAGRRKKDASDRGEGRSRYKLLKRHGRG